MDEYLDEEIESVRQTFETITKQWDKQANVVHQNSYSVTAHPTLFTPSRCPLLWRALLLRLVLPPSNRRSSDQPRQRTSSVPFFPPLLTLS